MTDRELMQEALYALTYVGDAKEIYSDTIESLRARLAQPEPKPVAWMDSDGFPWTKQGVECRTTPDTYTPLYTALPQREWQGLTDEEVIKLGRLDKDSDYFGLWYDFAQAIEAKLKEKNGG